MRSKQFLAVLLLIVPLQASALSINWSMDFTSPVAGRCVGSNPALGAVGDPGLGCYVSSGDQLTSPASNPVSFLTVRRAIDDPETIRAAVYEATGRDPGEVRLSAKADGGQGNLNGSGGLTVYDEYGIAGNNLFGAIARGLWEYQGPDLLSYFVVKAGRQALIWDISELSRAGVNDGDPGTILEGQFEMDSWYDLLDQGAKNPAMSHVSVYSRLTPPEPPQPPQQGRQVPVPSTALLIGSLVLAIGLRRRRRA